MPQAPELRVPYWIDAKGEERAALTLKELGTGDKVILAFKAECSGCHSFGCLLYTSPSPRDQRGSRMPSSA